MSVVLMYHALHDDGDTAGIDAEDLPYAVSRSAFSRQLDEIRSRNIGLLDHSSNWPEVIITFDDGHSSNLCIAADLLQERDLKAYFFVTTDFINQRPGFMSSDELGRLAQIPGMCIGSHGVTHHFFDDLSCADAQWELEQSRDRLEAWTGSACCSLSFPGGRFSKYSVSLAIAAGYCQYFGSEIGVFDSSVVSRDESGRQDDRWSLLQQQTRQPIGRVAIRRNTQMDEFRLIIDQDTSYFGRKQLYSGVKRITRQLLGNRLYHGLYKFASGR